MFIGKSVPRNSVVGLQCTYGPGDVAEHLLSIFTWNSEEKSWRTCTPVSRYMQVFLYKEFAQPGQFKLNIGGVISFYILVRVTFI